MSTSNFNVRIDNTLRAEATQILASYGLSPTQAIKLFFNQVVATRKVPLSFDYQAHKTNEQALTQQTTKQDGLEQAQIKGESNQITLADHQGG